MIPRDAREAVGLALYVVRLFVVLCLALGALYGTAWAMTQIVRLFA